MSDNKKETVEKKTKKTTSKKNWNEQLNEEQKKNT